MDQGIKQQTNLLEELARILGLQVELDPCFGPLLRKDEWKICQLTEEKPRGSGNLVNRLTAYTGLRDVDDSFNSPSPARVAEVLFGINAENPPQDFAVSAYGVLSHLSNRRFYEYAWTTIEGERLSFFVISDGELGVAFEVAHGVETVYIGRDVKAAVKAYHDSGSQTGKRGSVSRQAFREVAQLIADPNMTDAERGEELKRLFDSAD